MWGGEGWKRARSFTIQKIPILRNTISATFWALTHHYNPGQISPPRIKKFYRGGYDF